MNENADIAEVARRAADNLAPSLDPKLCAAVEQELTRDPLDAPPERVIEPISLAALIVSLASFGWTVYRDLKKDHDAAKAKANRRETEASLRRPASGRRELHGWPIAGRNDNRAGNLDPQCRRRRSHRGRPIVMTAPAIYCPKPKSRL